MLKKRTGIVLALLLTLAAGGGIYWYQGAQSGASQTGTSDTAVFADSVAGITGSTDTSGRAVRFAGVVEPQRIEKVELASGMKVKETYVTVGQTVETGTKLFAYDTDHQWKVTPFETTPVAYPGQVPREASSCERPNCHYG